MRLTSITRTGEKDSLSLSLSSNTRVSRIKIPTKPSGIRLLRKSFTAVSDDTYVHMCQDESHAPSRSIPIPILRIRCEFVASPRAARAENGAIRKRDARYEPLSASNRPSFLTERKARAYVLVATADPLSVSCLFHVGIHGFPAREPRGPGCTRGGTKHDGMSRAREPAHRLRELPELEPRQLL